jgi:hypothetical protein
MSKMSDILKQALDKKKGIHHIEPDGTPVIEKNPKGKTSSNTPGKKPPTRSAGRGR